MIHIFSAYSSNMEEMYAAHLKFVNQTVYLSSYYQIDESECNGHHANHKPQLCLKHLSLYPTSNLHLYTDIDVLIINNIDELDTQDYDILCTYRINKDISAIGWEDYLGFCNAGILGFYNNESTIKFIEGWEKQTIVDDGDQPALNHILFSNYKFWRQQNEHIVFEAPYKEIFYININDLTIKMVPAAIYNYYFIGPQNQAKILHFKGHARQLFSKYRDLLTKSR